MKDVAKIIAKIALFSHLSPEGIYRIAQLAQIKTFPPNTILIQEGKPGLSCFIIVQGKVQVIKDFESNHPVIVAELGETEIVGELSLIDGLPYSATVKAIEETKCIMIEQFDFKAQLQAYPEIALQLLPVLARRLRKMTEKTIQG